MQVTELPRTAEQPAVGAQVQRRVRPDVAEAKGQPMDNGHDSDCAMHNAPAYPAGPCDCMPTQAMCRAAVMYANGPDVYERGIPAKVLEIEEAIYAEVWKAMMAAAPGA